MVKTNKHQVICTYSFPHLPVLFLLLLLSLTKLHWNAGIMFVCAPVFGRPPAAMSGEVLWAPAGPPHALLQPYFDAMGRGTMQIGSEAYMASVMKLSGNFFIAATIKPLLRA